jgi:hypothetical protein
VPLSHKKDITTNTDKNVPTRAAKILGPALILIFFRSKDLTILCDKKLKTLYLDNSIPLKKKSIARNTINQILCDKPNNRINNTVKEALILATLSSTNFSEIGHIAYDFIFSTFKYPS